MTECLSHRALQIENSPAPMRSRTERERGRVAQLGGTLMMHQPITPPSPGWCILRTSGGQTLRLAASLSAAGVEAWTPRRTFKRPKPGKCALIDGRKPTIELDAPILPTFVFARAAYLADLIALTTDPASPHPSFSIFQHAGRAPEITDNSLTGLRNEERLAAELIELQRDCETQEERKRVRAMAMQTERARMKLLRSERRDFSEGEVVSVKDASMLAGMTGIVKSSDGRSAVIHFGGSFTAKVEAWQIVRDQV